MGSFNVACAISNISISSGTKIAFLPILPSEMNETMGRKYNKFNLSPGYVFLEPSANWVSNEGAYQFYKPFSLPIYGKYNDYGGIEDIEENITTDTIKSYFGISIEAFVDCIGNSRGMYDYYSPIFESYFEADVKLISDYHIKFNGTWLQKMGFTKIDNETYRFRDHDFTVSLKKVSANKKNHRHAGYGYQILGDRKKVLVENFDTYDNRKQFLDSYLKLTDFYIGYKEGCQDKIKMLRKLSGMFIHRDIYDYMTRNTFSEYSSRTDSGSWENDAYLSDDTLSKLGFKLKCEDKSIERYYKIYEYPGVKDYVMQGDGTWAHISKTSAKFPNGDPKQKHYVDFSVYHPAQLIKAWKELTNLDIIVSEEIRKESKFGSAFDQIRQQYLEFLKDEDEETKEYNRKKKEKAALLKSNPSELKKEILALKKDKDRYSLFLNLLKYTKSRDFDYDDSEDKKNKKIKPTDKEIGDQLIALNERTISSMLRNPLDEPEGHIYLPLKTNYDKYNMLKTLYEPNIVDGTIKSDIVDYCNFYWNCYAMNKVLMPSSNGYQCGCHSATLGLAMKTVELMKEKIKEYEEELEEDEA
jgi:hypothetical protein